jgi:hypothetical protein
MGDRTGGKPKKDWLDDFKGWPASVGLVARHEAFSEGRGGCNERTVRRWAGENGVRTIGGGKRIQYLFFKEDILNFRKRDRPGRRWKKGK